jgi:hypothetical protein
MYNCFSLKEQLSSNYLNLTFSGKFLTFTKVRRIKQFKLQGMINLQSFKIISMLHLISHIC